MMGLLALETGDDACRFHIDVMAFVEVEVKVEEALEHLANPWNRNIRLERRGPIKLNVASDFAPTVADRCEFGWGGGCCFHWVSP